MAFPTTTVSSGDLYWSGSARPTTEYTGVFIPAIWSAKLIEKFYDSTVLAAISNTDYEGEIRNQGDIVKIRTKPTITINDYTADLNLAVQRPSSNIVELNIDKGKYFNTVLDDVMEVQADLDMLSMWADDASEQMKITIDTDVLANIQAGVAAANKGNAAGRLDGGLTLGTSASPIDLVARNPGTGQVEVVDYITWMGQVLDEQNIPETGRWMIVPAWMASLIKRSELRDASLTGDSQGIARNGRLGTIDRFTLYVSNLLPTDTDSTAGVSTQVFAGHSHGLTFASQLTKVETLRAETTFGTLLRGLQVYGYKVVDGTALASGNVQKA